MIADLTLERMKQKLDFMAQRHQFDLPGLVVVPGKGPLPFRDCVVHSWIGGMLGSGTSDVPYAPDSGVNADIAGVRDVPAD
jgi:hypothetical protein